jgi:FKBP-type peptidyl-prolyl cis-trans isomerase FkpA
LGTRHLSWLLLAFAFPASAAAPDGGVPAAKAEPEKPVGYLKTADDKALYALGYSFGKNIQVFDLSKSEMEIVRKALTEGMNDQKPLIPLETYGQKLTELANSRRGKAAEKKAAKEKPFLDAAAKEKGAEVLASGVVYISERDGTGAVPKSTDEVKVNYRGRLTNGTEFDSSYKRNQPLSFQLDKVIPCWTEGVQKMKVGGKARLVCPAKAGYGERGELRAGIAPGAVLDFEVELLETKAPAPPPVPTPGTSPGFTPPATGK